MTPRTIANLPPPHEPESFEIRGALGLVYGYTIATIRNCQSQAPSFGTAVLLQVGPRVFAVSAAHCIEHDAFLGLTKEFDLPLRPTPVLNYRRSPNRDIGFLEVHPNQLKPGGLSGLPLECVSVDPPHVPPDQANPSGPPTVIVGYPFGEQIKTAASTRVVRDNYATHAVKVTDDMYQFSYPITVHGFNPTRNEWILNRRVVDPGGYSGCGAWMLNETSPDSLALPQTMLRLTAIQSSWESDSRRVTCIPIRYAVQLIFNAYPDLQDLLRERFEVLRT